MSVPMHKIVLPIAVLAGGIAVAMALASARTAPPREERRQPGPLVEAMTVAVDDHRVVVSGHGTVQPRIQAQVVPQVGGRVVSIHPDLVAGGYFSAGDTLIQIEAADYELAVRRAEAAVAQAGVRLQLEEGEAEVARREWDRLHPGEEPSSPLVLREPQVAQARAELAAAEADLESARLALERTRVSMPWDGRVTSESVDVGQMVVAGQPVASVYGTAALEIPVPLPDAEAAWLDLPGRSGGPGSAATVTTTLAGAPQRWTGRVARTEGEVDRTTRMLKVVVEVAGPASGSGRRPPLVPGMFVAVELVGRMLPGVAEVPRSAVRADGSLWVVADGRLEQRRVEVLHTEDEHTYVGEGLEVGERVLLTQLDVITDGMAVRVAGAAAQAGAAAPAAEPAEEVGS